MNSLKTKLAVAQVDHIYFVVCLYINNLNNN